MTNAHVPSSWRTSARARTGLFLLGYFVILLLASVPKSTVPPDLGPLVWGFISTLGLLTLTAAFLRREGRSFRDVGVNLESRSTMRFGAGLLVGAVTYALTCVAISVALGPLTFTRATTPAVGILALKLFTTLALAAMEELGFRGYALRTLLPDIGPWKAQLVIALAFALTHVAYGWPWQPIVTGVLPSAILFGVAAVVSGGVAMPLGVHVALNLAQWAVGAKETPGFWTVVVDDAAQARIAVYAPVIALVVTLCSSTALWRWHWRRSSGGGAGAKLSEDLADTFRC